MNFWLLTRTFYHMKCPTACRMRHIISEHDAILMATSFLSIRKRSIQPYLNVHYIVDACIFYLLYFNLFAGYYFNDTGLLVCEPFYSKPSYRILATCSLYFPTTMILMYCYGSSFHASRFRLVATPAVATTPSSTSEKVNMFT